MNKCLKKDKSTRHKLELLLTNKKLMEDTISFITGNPMINFSVIDLKMAYHYLLHLFLVFNMKVHINSSRNGQKTS
jgi:hypothetical protein